MKHLIPFLSLLLFLRCSTPVYAATSAEIKQQLKAKVTELRNTLQSAQRELVSLNDAKVTLEVQLKDMADWGIDQQKLKIEAEGQADKLTATLDQERKELTQVKTRYNRVRSYAGFLLGAVAALICMQIVGALGVLIPPGYSLLAKFLGPVAAFGAGYSLAFILF